MRARASWRDLREVRKGRIARWVQVCVIGREGGFGVRLPTDGFLWWGNFDVFTKLAQAFFSFTSLAPETTQVEMRRGTLT
jgi:hypothetical protein